MSRQAVGAVFVVFTAGTVMQLIEHAADAFSQPALRTWLIVVFWLLKVGIVSAFAYFVFVRPPALRRAREPLAFAACGAAILGAAALRAPEASGSTALLLAGDAIAVVSAGWLLVSVLALGRCFGFLPEARGLVTRGPYRVVRHPVYLGELGMAAGLLLAAPTAWNAAAVAVLTAGQLIRMRLEEQALAREFPEYGHYAARVPRLLPVRLASRPLAVQVDPGRSAMAALLAVGGVALCASHAASASAATRPVAPRLLAPGNSAQVAAVPSFSWTPVRRAAKYEFQLAADPHFESIVGGQGRGSFQTANTYASVDKTVADGTYYWRVRAIDARDRTSPWSSPRSLVKTWNMAPPLLGPDNGATVVYPRQPLVLRWSGVPYAYKYVVRIATDPELAHSALGDRTPHAETSGTSLALPWTLAPGRYFWGVTPLDSSKHPGRPSAVRSFVWSWPTSTTTRNRDMRTDFRLPDPFGAPRFYDPQLSWDPVPGAAQYQVEINPSRDFAPGSRVCCDDVVLGTSLSPRRTLPNNTYYWRVRALDLDGNAGMWNYGPGWSSGPSFRKDFAATSPSVPNLRVWDASPSGDPGSGPPRMHAPVVQWDSVPGASSYEVKVVPTTCSYDERGACTGRPPSNPCDWSASASWDVTTATPAWTPLAALRLGANPIGGTSIASIDGGRALTPGWGYCAMVRPIDRDIFSGDVRGDWTQLGGNGAKAFAFEAPPEQTPCATPRAMTDSDYRPAQDGRSAQQTFTENMPSGRVVTGTYNRRMPLLTWKPVQGACGYWVVVARDADFTQVVDLALTPEPAYAPRTGFGPVTYPEETTTYYWAVLPSQFADGRGVVSRVQDNAPQLFRKQSIPPQLLGPANGADVSTQPTFSWTVPRDEEGRPEEVRYYRLQVDDDPTFGSPIDDVVTDSTAYTSTNTYPADTRLYWRVRANDDNIDDRQRGLTWSYPESSGVPRWFTRRLPRPSLSPTNPTSGQGIPLFTWSPVPGAVSYDMHVEQADGTKRDFTFRSTAFTPIAFYGTGVWRWQVRANFKGAFRTVSSGYTPLAPFARRIDTPGGLRTTTVGSRAVLSWAPTLMVRQYRLQISTSDSFSTIIEDATTENTNYAPRMAHPAWRTGQALYWRVAAVDEGFNVGGWTASALRQSAPMRVKARGVVRLNRIGRVRVTVTDVRGRPLRAALVRVSGAGYGNPKRTSRRGRAVLEVRGLRKGKVILRVQKNRYLPRATSLRVRVGRSST